MRRAIRYLLTFVLAAMPVAATQAHDGPVATSPPADRDAWIELGTRVHGGFGTLIALGIRIGDDAMRELKAKPRELDVTYYSGAEAPCPCAVDGIIVAASSSPGQNSLRVSPDKAEAGQFGRALIRHKPTGRTLEYVVPISAWPTLRDANKLPIVARWNAVMEQPDDRLFARRELPKQ